MFQNEWINIDYQFSWKILFSFRLCNGLSNKSANKLFETRDNLIKEIIALTKFTSAFVYFRFFTAIKI